VGHGNDDLEASNGGSAESSLAALLDLKIKMKEMKILMMRDKIPLMEEKLDIIRSMRGMLKG
jgi:hypothetical protein